MSEHLKVLADASLATEEAETALGEGEPTAAEEALDRADATLMTLRDAWPSMGPGERAIVGPAAKDVRARADAARKRLPKRRALSEIAPVEDPEQDVEPEDDAGPGDGPPAAT